MLGGMTANLRNITIDCADPATVASFWSAVLDRPVDAGGNEWMCSIGMKDPGAAPRWLFLKVPEPKTAKNRMHVDLTTDDREKEVQRLVELGAARIADKQEYGLVWTVLTDPEGNEFCVAAE
jgi:predicted enzyme related to lactoylglutathione lyase